MSSAASTLSSIVSAIPIINGILNYATQQTVVAETAPPLPEPDVLVQQTQDPIGVAIKVALLYDAVPGTKLSFEPYNVNLQGPGFITSGVRTAWRQSHNEIVVLKTILPNAFYLIQSFDEAPRKRIYFHVLLGLKALAKTYEHDRFVKEDLTKLHGELSTSIQKPIPKDKVIEKNPFFRKVREIWQKHVNKLDSNLNGDQKVAKEKEEGKYETNATAAKSSNDSKSSTAVTTVTATVTSPAITAAVTTDLIINKLSNLNEITPFLEERNKEFRQGISQVMMNLFGFHVDKTGQSK